MKDPTNAQVVAYVMTKELNRTPTGPEVHIVSTVMALFDIDPKATYEADPTKRLARTKRKRGRW